MEAKGCVWLVKQYIEHMVLLYTRELKPHTPVMWFALHRKLQANFWGARNIQQWRCAVYLLTARLWGVGKVCTNSNQNPSNTCSEQIGRVFPSKFRQSATFFALGAQVGARRSPLAMKNNLGVLSKSNDGFPASVQSCCLQGGNAMETKNHLQSKGASVSPHAPCSWGKTWVLLCLTRMK